MNVFNNDEDSHRHARQSAAVGSLDLDAIVCEVRDALGLGHLARTSIGLSLGLLCAHRRARRLGLRLDLVAGGGTRHGVAAHATGRREQTEKGSPVLERELEP